MNDMFAALQSYSGAIAVVISVASALIATRFVTREAHEKATGALDAKVAVALEKIDKAEDRIAALENEMRHLPDRESVHRINVTLAEVKGELRAMGEQLKPVASIADRLQEFLLEQARK